MDERTLERTGQEAGEYRVRRHAGLQLRVDEEAWYYLVQLNCDEDQYEMDVRLVAMNPGGEYLSLADVPNKTLFRVLSVVWSILALAWAGLCLPYYRFNVRIHALLGLVAATEVVRAAVLDEWWNDISHSGERPHNLTYWAMNVLSLRPVMVLVALLLAQGYGFVFASISEVQTKTILFLVGFIVLGEVTLLAGVAIFAVVVVFSYYHAFRYIVVSIARVRVALDDQMQILRTAGIRIEGTPVHTKSILLDKSQVSLFTGGLAFVITRVWGNVMFRFYRWYGDLLADLIFMCAWLTVCYLFRPKPFNPFYHSVELDDGRPVYGPRRGYVWRPCQPVPRVDDGWRAHTDTPTIIVYNPPRSRGAPHELAMARALDFPGLPEAPRGAAAEVQEAPAQRWSMPSWLPAAFGGRSGTESIRLRHHSDGFQLVPPSEDEEDDDPETAALLPARRSRSESDSLV